MATEHPSGQYKLDGRVYHHTQVIDNSLYLWGGDSDNLPHVHNSEKKRRVTSHIQIFDITTGRWNNQTIRGNPPLGVDGYFCATVDNKIYYFGGYCGHDECFHNSLHELNISTLTWTQLQPTNDRIAVMKRSNGGMISSKGAGRHCLLLIGGFGSPPTIQLPQAQYYQYPYGKVSTNEQNIYDLTTGQWIIPKIIGQCMPPNANFVMEAVNITRAIIFGGMVEGTSSNTLYILDIINHTVHWQTIAKPDPVVQWPEERLDHAASIITGPISPILVMIGGMYLTNKTIKDCWILDINEKSWTKINLPYSVTERYGHSLSTFIMGPYCVWLIVVGGKLQFQGADVTDPNITMLIELVLNDGQWSVGFVLDSNALSVIKSVYDNTRPQKNSEKDEKEESSQEKELQSNYRKDLLVAQEDIKSLQERLLDIESQQVQEKDNYITELQKKDEIITTLQKQLEQSNQQIQEKDNYITELQKKDEIITTLQKQLEQSNQQIQEKDNYITELQKKDEIITTLQKQPEQSNQQIQEKDNYITELKKKVKTITTLQSNQQKFLIAAFAILLLAVVIAQINIIAVNVKTDTLHISKRVIGGTVDYIQWADSSFTMNIFANCFPKGNHVDVLVSIDHYFQLETPKGYKLLSPKYQITASERLQSPVSITLKHNAAVTNREVAESLAILYLSDEGKKEIFHGKAEPNSTYITFQLSNLCHIVVIGLDHINQTYWLAFYRQLKSYETDPLLLIRCIVFPFTQSKDLEEELQSQGWIASDNSCTQGLVGNGTVYLIVEPIECWNITGSTYNNSMTIKNQPVSSDIIMQYKTSNCDTHKSFIKFRNSYDDKIYFAFFGDKIILTIWDNFLKFIKDNVVAIVGIGIAILIVILIGFLRILKPEEDKHVIKVVHIIIGILIAIFLHNYGVLTAIGNKFVELVSVFL